MNEAKQLHRDLMNAIVPILPRSVYHDIRRVVTLAWAVTGLCRKGTVRLSAWAEEVTSAAHYAASRVRRFGRFLHNDAINPALWYPPLLRSALIDWTEGSRAYVALDTTVLPPFVLIRASLIYRGRAIPLAWRALRRASAMVSFDAYQPVLEQVRAIVPRGVSITLLADRGFLHEQLITYTRQHGWHFRLRMTSDTLVQRAHQPTQAVSQLRPPLGHAHFYHQVALFGSAIGPVHLALASPPDQPTDPWYIVSDEATDLHTLDEFALRFDIEESFLDDKSGAFQVQTTELTTPEALERLFLILAIATLYCTSIGVGVVRAQMRRWVDTHWDRGLSYLKIGWRWLNQQYHNGWQAFRTFWLDPAPDPEPAIMSRRQAALPKRQWRIVLQC
jgi:DDE family transposase